MKILLFILSAAAIYRFGEDSRIQPSHFIVPVMTIIFSFILFFKKNKIKINKMLTALIFCTFYFFFRNIFEILVSQDLSLLANAFYWINFTLIVILLNIILIEDEWIYLSRCLFFNVFISSVVGLYQLLVHFPIRAHGLSGTENHLALQIVHVALICLIICPKSNISVGFLRFLGISTLSRAYIIHVALLFVLKKIKPVVFLIFLIIILGLTPIFKYNFNVDDFISNAEYFDFIVQRMSLDGNSSDQDGRGYLRVFNNVHYLLYGASEVVREFYGDPFYGQIHSNFLSLFFCFGIFGAIFGVIVFLKIFEKFGMIVGVIYFVYSLTGYFYSNLIFLLFVAFLFYPKSKNNLSILNKLSR